MGFFCCRCSSKCFVDIGPENIQDSFNRFYSGYKTKDEQDLFLHGLIDVEDVATKRPGSRDNKGKEREENEKTRPKKKSGGNSNTFRYHVLVGDRRVKVCAAAFISIYGISEKRVRRIRQLKTSGKPVRDLRGAHTSYTLDPAVYQAIDKHIRSYPTKITHYSGKEKQFLSEKLNVKLMHQMFLEEHQVKVSYQAYWAYFNANFNLSFGQPQVDTCCTCEELSIKIKSPHLNDVAKRAAVAEKIVHKRRSNKFFNRIKEDVADAKIEINTNVLSLAIDYMQNISLPLIPVQELFYMRQLTVSVFCIHDVKKNVATIYLYHEGEARKSPNETCSFILDYLSSVPQGDYDELNIYADNCGGQNKNHCFSKLFQALTDLKRFKKINQFFPIRGHSFLPCDRDFSIIKRELKKHDRIYSVREITEIIIKSSKTQKFVVVEVDSSRMVYNVKDWWSKFYKRNVASEETKRKRKEERIFFGISKFHHFEYNSDHQGVCKARQEINGILTHTFKMSKNTIDHELHLPDEIAYPTGKVSIKVAKINDLRRCLQYIPHEHAQFYEEILQWPQDNAPNVDENVDETD